MKFDTLNSVEILMDFYYQRNEYVMSEKSKSLCLFSPDFSPSFDKLHRKFFHPRIFKSIKFQLKRKLFSFAENKKVRDVKIFNEVFYAALVRIIT